LALSFALASFPALSRAWADKEKGKFSQHFFSVFTQIIFFIIPVSFLMFLLRAQIVRLFYGTGKFTWVDTRLTAVCLGVFCIGIFACALIPFLARVFYSFYNTKIPAIIGIISMFVNVFLCFFFIWILNFQNIFSDFLIDFLHLQGIENIQIVGLPLALALASIVQFFMLFIVLTKKIEGIRLRLKEIFISFGKVFLASILSAFSAYLTLYFVSDFVNMQTFLGILAQTISATIVGISVYLFLAYILRCKELKAIRSSIFKEFDKS
jgi:putative peptidoglycan lipid II flippase